jgi:hypothetical protein
MGASSCCCCRRSGRSVVILSADVRRLGLLTGDEPWPTSALQSASVVVVTGTRFWCCVMLMAPFLVNPGWRPGMGGGGQDPKKEFGVGQIA